MAPDLRGMEQPSAANRSLTAPSSGQFLRTGGVETVTSIPATLSVVLPNYNHARFVGRALKALLCQKRAADEIIVIDDGSTDDSVRIIDEIAAGAPAIRVLRNENNIGVIATLQRGLEVARGNYVYFAASDDWILPDFFALALRRLEADPDVGLFCGEAVLVDGTSNQPFAVRPAVRPRMSAGSIDVAEVNKLLRATDNWILTGSAVFRRECVAWAGGFDARLGSFADGFIARKIALRYGFYFEPKIVASWVVFPDSVSRHTARDLQRSKYILDAVPKLIAADSGFPSWYAGAFRDRWRFATCRLALQADPIERAVVLELGAQSVAEKAKYDTIMRLLPRQPARFVLMAWLWYRLRPTSLTALLRTMLAMRGLRLALGFRSGRIPGMTAPLPPRAKVNSRPT
jgi:glycosyltransferase involved in cell wall biosynthesis